jgi:3-deoxy-D-manno-octulosonate 8-phosphate phosphatase (KDO 8-P phosphatase)
MQSILARAKSIKLLVLDVDGVLTDGGIYLDDNGVQSLCFHIQDGLGIKLLQKTGVQVAIITGRQSQVVALRAKMLGISHLYQGNVDKRQAYIQLRQHLQLQDSQIAYVGDDLPDLPLLQQVGLSVAVANARQIIKNHTHWQTQAIGGSGAVREVCELIMQAQGTWDKLEQEFYA